MREPRQVDRRKRSSNGGRGNGGVVLGRRVDGGGCLEGRVGNRAAKRRGTRRCVRVEGGVR